MRDKWGLQDRERFCFRGCQPKREFLFYSTLEFRKTFTGTFSSTFYIQSKFSLDDRPKNNQSKIHQRSLPFITWLILTQLKARVQPLGDSFPGLRPCTFFSERWSSSWKAPSRRCGFHVRSYEQSPACPWLGTSRWLHCHLLSETIESEKKEINFAT